MSEIRGIGSDRTTFNEKQEVGALKIGILKKNQELRNSILKRNIGRYEKYDGIMTPAVGEIENIYQNEGKLPTIVGDLLEFTHGYTENKTELRRKIDDKYGEIFKFYYDTNLIPNNVVLPWKGRFSNYMEHVSEVYGIDGHNDGKFTLGDAYDAVVDVLKYFDSSFMAKDMAVDVVRNINVANAMSGVITTNVVNMSNSETSLGYITNLMYGHTLYNASLVNDTRKRQYITPELDSHVGNTWKTIGLLSDLFPIQKSTGRVTDEFEWEIDGNINNDEIPFNGIIEALNNNQPIYEVSDFNSGLRYSNFNHEFKDTSFYGPYVSTMQYTQDLKKGKSINTIGKVFKKIGSTFGGVTNVGGGVDLEIEGEHMFTASPEILSKKVIKGYIGEGFNIDRSFHGYTTSLDTDLDFEIKKDDDLLSKTNKLFHNGSIKSLISRYRNSTDTEMSLTQTAVSNFGVSRGRNLLRKDTVINSGKNPYCRVWTMFHQYNQYEDAIRGNGEYTHSKMQDKLESLGQRTRKGWQTNSVLNDNNTVQIAPYKDMEKGDVYTKSKAETGTTRGYIKTDAHIHKYMFSIENLAWKDSDQFIDNLTPSQRGPNGGRIMWFPPYDLEFTENISPDWEPHSFIGRGEKIYTYKDTERNGTLSFTMLIDHPSTIDLWANENGDKTTDSDEMDLLRYFAGCGELPISVNLANGSNDKCSDVTIDNKGKNKELENILNAIERDEALVTEVPISIVNNTLEFYIFFPNNFSGKDYYNKIKTKDDKIIDYKKPTKGDNSYEMDCEIIEPITYLLKGTGTQYFPNKQGTGYEMSTSLSTSNNYAIKYGKNEWYYRIDCDRAHEKLKSIGNYKDSNCKQLNSNIDSVKTYALGIMKNTESSENTFILTLKDINEILNGEPSNSDNRKIKDLLLNSNTNISNIEIKGFASSHGYSENNKKLAQDRGNTVYNWLKSTSLKNKLPDNVHIESDVVTVDETDKTNINGVSAKAARVARVYIEFDTMVEEAENNKTENNETNVSKTETLNATAPKQPIENEGRIPRRQYDKSEELLLQQIDKYYWMDEHGYTYTYDSKKEKYVLAYDDTDVINESLVLAFKPQCVSTVTKKPLQETSLSQNEYKYFENIAKQKTPLFHKISEKIKYFDPAFHSLTPEGFNARLNFLHQCTRQGPTCGASDTKGFSAGNLSFGRPPYCVLRIGDFYHTKILINSISINYGEHQWDLNPEGVGVQPMMAKIDINFVFLGGSDLGGPINRLQNAISFNYYANTSVYDDRAKVFKSDTWEESTEHVWTYDDGTKMHEIIFDDNNEQLYRRKQ